MVRFTIKGKFGIFTEDLSIFLEGSCFHHCKLYLEVIWFPPEKQRNTRESLGLKEDTEVVGFPLLVEGRWLSAGLLVPIVLNLVDLPLANFGARTGQGLGIGVSAIGLVPNIFSSFKDEGCSRCKYPHWAGYSLEEKHFYSALAGNNSLRKAFLFLKISRLTFTKEFITNCQGSPKKRKGSRMAGDSGTIKAVSERQK